jgi:hypothetical protein
MVLSSLGTGSAEEVALGVGDTGQHGSAVLVVVVGMLVLVGAFV